MIDLSWYLYVFQADIRWLLSTIRCSKITIKNWGLNGYITDTFLNHKMVV